VSHLASFSMLTTAHPDRHLLHEVGRGSLDSVIVTPREVFTPAIMTTRVPPGASSGRPVISANFDNQSAGSSGLAMCAGNPASARALSGYFRSGSRRRMET
jgi:hypothetical protein